jgi:hypothetical protein
MGFSADLKKYEILNFTKISLAILVASERSDFQAMNS